ncbi:PREDICTED: uncharacterized protein LOC108758979, partial [Trachymyrmex cornetzi]|uniref:uncharacterized protein LOC108758979 n=1 Tax=Trachymyrmex cornetzi TaxID=471704 RepID=UPI00084F16EC
YLLTSDICNEKWMTFQVRYPDPGTLEIRTQLVELINIDAKDSSADKLFNSFKNKMYKFKVPFSNIIALSCDNASVMTGKHVSFQKKLEKVCPHLLTFPCPCHSAALAAHAASDKIPEVCDRFTKIIVTYINSSLKRLAVFREFCECFEGKTLKLLKLSDTRWLPHHACVERLLKYWDTIKNFLQEAVVSEKTKSAENLLSIMNNVETKAYFLFLEYVLNFFNQFNAYFQASQTRIHVLQSKCLQFLYNICRHFLKAEHLKPFSINITFSLKENQKNLNEIDLGYDCEEYLNELETKGHEDIVTTVR